MSKIETTVLLLSFSLSFVTCQDLVSRRILEERSLQNALSKVEGVLEHLDDLKTNGISGKIGDTSYKVTNIKITNHGKIGSDIKTIHGIRNVILKLTVSYFTAEAKWWIQYKPSWISITRSGSLKATARKLSVTVSLVSFKVQNCKAHADISVDINGGGIVVWVLEVIKGQSFINNLESVVEKMICGAVMKL